MGVVMPGTSTHELVDFSVALTAMKAQRRVRRREWPPGAFIVLVPGMLIAVHASERGTRGYMPAASDLACGGRVLLHCSNGVWIPGWVATQIELCAEDWEVLDERDGA